MTNEERVKEIQNGQNVTENMERLFVDNKAFIAMIIYKTLKTRTIPADTMNDFTQGAYLALVEAVEKYDSSKGFKFLSYYSFYIKTQLLRRDLPQSKLFSYEPSLDVPSVNAGEDGEPLLNVIHDNNTMPIDKEIELKDLQEQLWKEVRRSLSEDDLYDIVIQKFKGQATIKEIAARHEVTPQRMNGMMQKAMAHIRNNKRMYRYRDCEWDTRWHSTAYKTIGAKNYRNTSMSSTDRAVFQKMGIYY